MPLLGQSTVDGGQGPSDLTVAGLQAHMTIVVIFERCLSCAEIQLRDAKASLSAVVDEAVRGKPAVIIRHGKREVVVVSYEEWERLSRVPTFGRLLMAAPLTTDDLPSGNSSGLRTTEL
jgi:antitoxin Phd